MFVGRLHMGLMAGGLCMLGQPVRRAYGGGAGGGLAQWWPA
mgnify:CR=1 FL=1